MKYKNLLHKLVNKAKISYFHHTFAQHYNDQKKIGRLLEKL